jgi:hypothetical protein
MTPYRTLVPVCVLITLLVALPEARSGAEEEQPASNLALIRSLALRVGERVAAEIRETDSVSVSVRVLPKESAWYVESSILQGLAKFPLRITEGSGNALEAEFGIGQAGVVYSNVRRDGFFGTKLVDRTIALLLSVKVVDPRSGTILIARDYSEDTSDTIPLDAVADVESPLLPVTRGAVPSEGLFANAVEPAVMLGAIAVAVYLLFSVRN